MLKHYLRCPACGMARERERFLSSPHRLQRLRQTAQHGQKGFRWQRAALNANDETDRAALQFLRDRLLVSLSAVENRLNGSDFEKWVEDCELPAAQEIAILRGAGLR